MNESLSRVRGTGRIARCAAWLLACALGVLATAPAAAQSADRVLLNTKMTIGSYDIDSLPEIDYWGYADSTAPRGTAVTAGALGDATFTYDGVEYTVHRITAASGGEGGFTFDANAFVIKDGGGTALPATAAVGLEFATPDAAVLIDWRRLGDDRTDLDDPLEAHWKANIGNALALRVLDLGENDIWSAQLVTGRDDDDTGLTGYGHADAPGSLTPTTFNLNGVDYTVDRLTVNSATTDPAPYKLHFSTTPDLPASAQVRLAVAGYAFDATPIADVVRYYPVTATHESTAADIDFEWDLKGGRVHSLAVNVVSTPLAVYLTRDPATILVTLSVAPAEVREGTAVELLVTATPTSPPAAATAVTLAFGAAGDSAEAADYTAGSLVLTIAAGSLSATGRVAFTAVDDAETEDAETVTVGGTTSDLPVIGATVTIPRNDFGIYLDATLTVGSHTSSNSTGYAGGSVSFGSLEPRSFVCCVGATGGEAEYTINALFNRVGATYFGYGVGGLASPTDDLVLQVGGDSRRLGSYESFPTLLGGIGVTRAWGSLVPIPADGQTVPVRITGPKHAVVTDLSAVSTPRAMASGNSKLVYGPGDVLRLQVSYDEPVTVTGAPHLLFDVHNADTDTTTRHRAAYAAADSTATQLVFGYTVDAMTAVAGNPVLLQDADTATDGVQPPLVLDAGEKIESVAVRTNRTASRWLPARDLGTDHGLNNTATAVTAHTVALAGPARVSESGGTVEYGVRVDRAATAAVSVAYALTGTATAGEDYAGTATGRVSIGTGARAAKLSIAITDDDAVEPDETLTVTLYAPVGATLASGRTAVTTTIADDDTPLVTLAAPALQTATGHVFESEADKDNAAGDGHWRLTRTGSLDAPLTVTVQPADASGGFAASTAAQTLTFEKDVAMVRYSPVTGDDVDEPHGMVTVTLLEGDGYDAMGRTAQSAMVRDDDGVLVTTSLANVSGPRVAEGGKVPVVACATTVEDGTFTETDDLGRIFSVDRFPVFVSSGSGTATEDTDFSEFEKDAVLRFATARRIGDALKLCDLAGLLETTTDAETEGDETLKLVVYADTDLYDDTRIAVGTPAEVQLTITDAPLLTISLSDDELTEGETATVTATVSPAQSTAFQVALSFFGAVGRLALVGDNDMLSFAASATASTGLVQYRAVQNEVDEPDADAVVFGAPNTVDIPVATVGLKVKDDDGPLVSIDPPALHTATGHLFEQEGEEARHTSRLEPFWILRRAGQTDAELAVKVRSSEAGGGDFVAAADETTDKTVTFDIGKAWESYTPVVNDSTDEPHGTVTVTVRDGTDYDVDAAAGAATASVRDDDGTTRMTVTFHPAALSVPEGAPAQVYAQADTDATFTSLADFSRVTFSVDRRLPVVVSSEGTDSANEALPGIDYDIYRESRVFRFADFKPAPGGAGLRHRLAAAVQTRADTTVDPDETFKVFLKTDTPATALPAWATLGTPGETTVTIREGPAVTLALSDAELTEGETATVTATVDPTHATAFTVTVATDPATSTRYEFVGTNRTLSFAANTAASTGVVQIKATPNDVDEADLEATLTATPSASAVSGGAGVAFTVVDDDLQTVSIAAPPLAGTGVDAHIFEFEAAKSYAGTLQADQKTELENRAAWQLTRAGLLDEPLTVTVSVSETGGDFVDAVDETTHQVAFEAAEDTATFKIVTDDEVDEAHGTVTVTVQTGTDYAVSATASASAVAVRDDDGMLLRLDVDPLDRTVLEGNSGTFDAVLTTVDAGLQAGTFTEKTDIGRVLRYRSGFFRGRARTTLRFDWETTAVEAAASVDFTSAASTRSFQVANFVAKGTAFELRAALPPLVTLVNDDGTTGTADDTETIPAERLVVRLTPTTTGEGNHGGRAFNGPRTNIADLTDSSDNVVELDGGTAVVTIVEGVALTLTLDPTTIAEGDDDAGEGQATVTAAVTPAQTTAFNVEVTATSADDDRWEFVGASQTLSFAANETAATGTVTIRAKHNDVDDVDLAVTVTGTADASSGLPAATATLTVTDDDLPKVSIAMPVLQRDTGHVYEAEAAATISPGRFWLTREGLTDEALVVQVRPSESGGDFVDSSVENVDKAVTFKIGQTMVSYAPVTIDTDDEQHGTVTATLQTGSTYDIAGAAAATANVRDDDGALLLVTVGPAALAVPEGQAAQFRALGATVGDGTFSAAGDLGRVFGGTGLTVNAATAAGTATAGTDFTALAADASAMLVYADASVAGGGLGLAADLPPIATAEDTTDDPDETFTVTVSLPSGGDSRIGLGTPATATATIREGPVVTLALDDAELTEGETATVTATVDPTHDAQFTVTVATDPPSSERWSFVAGRTLTFAPNAASSTGSVRIRATANTVDDGDVEDIEATGTTTVAEIQVVAAAFEVLDDDLPKVSIAAPVWQRDTGHVYEAETAGNDPPLGGRFWLTREGLTDEALEVKVRPSESGGDFVAMTMENTDATVTFGIDATMVSYSPVSRDTDDEMHGTVTATLQSGSTYDIAGAAAATANLRDDDGALLTVTVGPAALAVPEGQAAQFRALGATVGDGTFSAAGDLGRVFGGTGLAVNAATAAGTATAGTDFTALAADASAMLAYADATVAGGGATAGLELAADLPPIATAEDTTDDPDETFTVTVSLPSGVDSRIGLGTPATATATIREGPVVTLALDDAELTEGQTATVTATVDPTHDAQFTVTVATDPPSSERWSFVAGRTLTFAPNAASSTGSVRIRATANTVDDGDVEDIEATGTTTVAEIQVVAAAFEVLDDDDPTVSVTRPSAVADGFMYESEAGSGSDEDDDGTGAWTVTRDGEAPDALEVKVRVAESSSGDGDFVAAADQGERTLTLAEGDTGARVYAVTDDTTHEAHGRVTVTVLAGTGYDVSTGAGASAVAVRDDDGTLLTLTVAPAALEVTEGTNAKLYAVATAVDDGTFTRKEHVARLFGTTATTATAASANGTATAPADYAALPSNTAVTLRYADLQGTPLTVRAALPEIATVREAAMGDAGETFTVTVAKASTEVDTRIAAGTPATATVTLTEGPPNGKLRLCDGGGTCVEEDRKWSACDADGTCEEQDTTRDVPLEGRLEIAYSGEWGTVCDDYWTQTDAAVACRRLGHAGAVDALVGSAFGGAAPDVPVWLDDVQCRGDESDLLACPRTGGIAVGAHNCPTQPRHQEDAGVRCAATTDTARGHLIFRTPDGVEHERNASLAVAAGAIARYGIRLSTKPSVLRDGYGQLYVHIAGATPRLRTYPERHVWAAPDRSDPDDDRWTQAREVTVSVSPNASGEVVLSHTVDRRGHPDDKFAGTYRLTVTVEGARAGRPGAPADLSVQAQGDVDVLAEWQPSADAGAEPLEGYRLESRAGGGWDEIAATEPDDTYHYDRDALQDVRSRAYRVAAANAHGAGPYSAAATATRPAPSSAARGAVYLADGSVPWEGAVTVFRDGAWGAACAAGWDLGGAHAACRRAGYARALQAYTVAASGTACGSGRSAGAVCAPPDGTETGAPRLTEASADGARVTLRFDAPLDATFAPAARDFLVLSGGPEAASRRDHPVLSASVAGATLELRVAPPVEPGAAVGVGYLRPALHPLRAAAGGAAVAAFEDAVVRNRAANLDDGRGDVALAADSARQTASKDTARLAVDDRSAASPLSPAPLGRAAGLAAALAAALADGAEPWSLVALDASGRRIADLAGIESLTALRELNLAGNALGDVAALADLANLRVLDLSGNRVADLWPLASLGKLERLALSGNRVADAMPLAGLERLRVLDLSHNAVTDLAALGGLARLEYLSLADNGLWNADRLAKLRGLVRLDLADNALADVGALWELRNVVWLRVSGNRVATVDGLGRLVRLRWVWLADNPLGRGAASSVRGLPPRVWTDLPADRGARDGR